MEEDLKKRKDADYFEYIKAQKKYLEAKMKRRVEEEEWELDPKKVCKIDDETCEACQ